jgi:hypothetical protein
MPDFLQAGGNTLADRYHNLTKATDDPFVTMNNLLLKHYGKVVQLATNNPFPLYDGRVGERATRTVRPTLPSSNRTCGFPASGSPENSRLGHAQAVARSRAHKYTKPRRLKWSL